MHVVWQNGYCSSDFDANRAKISRAVNHEQTLLNKILNAIYAQYTHYVAQCCAVVENADGCMICYFSNF